MVPSCYLNLIDLNKVKKSNNERIKKLSNKFTTSFQKRILTLQIITSTVILLITIGILAVLVNFTGFKYEDNIFNKFEFNVFCIVLTLIGTLGLIFMIDTNILNILRSNDEQKDNCLSRIDSKNKKCGLIIRTIITLIAVLILLSPALGGYIYSNTNLYLVFNSIDYQSKTLDITIIQANSYTSSAKREVDLDQWSGNTICNDENYLNLLSCEKNYFKGGNIIISRTKQRCFKSFLNLTKETLNCLGFNSAIIIGEEKSYFKQARIRRTLFSHNSQFSSSSLRTRSQIGNSF